MPNRITGLQSGLDTESLITSMVSRYQQKVDKLTEMQKKHTWKQNVWKEINKQVLSFYNDTQAPIESKRRSYPMRMQPVS